ncbi:hypothetical protein HDZ31DRAFT_29694 [Schizophyllum fasciatum]
MKSEEREGILQWDDNPAFSAVPAHPNKRRRIDTTVAALDFVSDINLEIGLRQRLAETLESRLTWALLLKETLEREASNSAAVPDSYEEAAFEALSAIDNNAQVLFDREPSPPPLADVDARGTGRGRPSNARARQASAVDKPEFLYIRSTTAEGAPRTFVMSCPACNRTTFTNLQGLYNHARLAHQLAWGTHEECIRAAARLVPDDEYVRWDFARGIQVGNGSGGGMLPGLRTLFQMAVGELEEQRAVEVKRTESVLLTRSLGLHGDSPALAPFLGRQVKKREIKATDEDAEVDIDGVEENMRRLRVRVPRTGRGTVPESVQEDITTSLPVAPDTAHGTVTGEGSRFHISSRIVIADRSLWIPEDRRLDVPRGHTHKWMVSVDAPAYSQHITTILRSITVNPASQQPADAVSATAPADAATSPSSFGQQEHSVSSQTTTTTEPPFVVRGTATAPFLARVELVFGAPVPGREDQRELYEHWVSLDPLRRGMPVLGDEQIVDVDLDRGTVFLPKRDDYTPVGSRALWDAKANTGDGANGGNQGQAKQPRADGREDYEVALEELVRRFPLLATEAKPAGGGRARNPSLPYTVTPTAAQFCALLPGKRKAIEWARARALRDAYMASRGPDDIPLSTADVFSWLQDNGYSVRPAAPAGSEQAANTEKDEKANGKRNHQLQPCDICGFYVRLHPDPPSAARAGGRSASVASVKTEEMAVNLQMSASMPSISAAPPVKRKPGRPKGSTTANRVKAAAANASARSGSVGSSSARRGSTVREGSTSTVKHEDEPPFECTLVAPREQLRARPIVDVEEWLRRRPSAVDAHTSPRSTTWLGSADFRELPRTVDPALVRAIWRIARAQKLPTLPSLPRTAPPAPYLPPAELGDRVAPHALLALATRAFARAVLQCALDTAAGDLRVLKRSLTGAPARRKKNFAADVRARVLTPTHVLRGLVARGMAPADGLGSALFMTVARVGVLHDEAALQAQSRQLDYDAEDSTASRHQGMQGFATTSTYSGYDASVMPVMSQAPSAAGVE